MSGLIHAHSGLRWLLFIGIVASFVFAITLISSKEENKGLVKLTKITFILSHIQALVGLVLWFMSAKVDFSMMKSSLMRFYSAEHPLMMVIAIVLISVGYIKYKKGGFLSHKTIAIFFGLALLLLIAGIPWPFRGLGAGWF